MSKLDFIWFRFQYLKDGEDDFVEVLVNFSVLISFLASVERYKLLKISKVDVNDKINVDYGNNCL